MSLQPEGARRPGTSGWRIGRIGGAALILTPGSLVLGAVLFVVFLPTFRAALGDGPLTYLLAAVLPLGLLASVLCHELAHGLTARRLGVPVTEYVLTLWGGHTAFERGLDRPGASALVAAVGPLANVVLGVGALVAADFFGGGAGLGLLAVAYVNLVLAAFNLLPGLPMDGGRLLEALVWRLRGKRSTGTLVAARGGQVIAVAVVLFVLGSAVVQGRVPSLLTIAWAVLIAVILWGGARGEVRRAKAQRSSASFRVAPLLHPVGVHPLDASVADLDLDSGQMVLVAANGYPQGVVDVDALHAVPAHVRDTTPVQAVARAVPPHGVLTDLHGTSAVVQVAQAARSGLSYLIAVRPDESRGTVEVLGVLEVDAVIRALQA